MKELVLEMHQLPREFKMGGGGGGGKNDTFRYIEDYLPNLEVLAFGFSGTLEEAKAGWKHVETICKHCSCEGNEQQYRNTGTGFPCVV